jgi:hypothetical protein
MSTDDMDMDLDMDIDEDNSLNLSTSHGDDNKKADTDENSESTLAWRETRQVKHLRYVVIAILVGSLVLVAFGIYQIIRGGEQNNFEAQFLDQSSKVIDSFHLAIERKVGNVDSLSISITSYANRKNLTWPLVTVSDFHILGSSVRALTEAVSVSLLPLVTAENRAAWEAYSTTHKEWIDRGLVFGQQPPRNDSCSRRKDKAFLIPPAWPNKSLPWMKSITTSTCRRIQAPMAKYASSSRAYQFGSLFESSLSRWNSSHGRQSRGCHWKGFGFECSQ